MIVEKKHHDNFTILNVEGLIKLGESAEFFSSALENVLKNESSNVIIDFTKIDYIDSTGIGELVGFLGRSRLKGWRSRPLVIQHRRSWVGFVTTRAPRPP